MRPWSYSRLKTYEDCPAKYKFRYVDRHVVSPRPSPAADRGSEIHEKAENYLLGNVPIYPPELQQVSGHAMLLKTHKAIPEHKIGVKSDWSISDYNDPDVYIRAIFDIVYQDGTVLHIQDWKTGKVYDTHEQQMKDYAAIGLSIHPDVTEVRTRLIYIDQGVVTPTKAFPTNHIVSLRELLKGRIQQAEDEKVFPTRQGRACRFCDFAKKNDGPCKF